MSVATAGLELAVMRMALCAGFTVCIFKSVLSIFSGPTDFGKLVNKKLTAVKCFMAGII